MNDKEQIEALYRTYWKYMIEKNSEGMRRIMTEDYVLMHMTGLRQKREDFFRSVKSGELNYYSAVHDGIDVSVTGDRARMTGKSRVSAAVYGGGPVYLAPAGRLLPAEGGRPVEALLQQGIDLLTLQDESGK